MPQDTHLETLQEIANRSSAPGHIPEKAGLAADAAELARLLAWSPATPSSQYFSRRCAALAKAMRPILAALHGPRPKTGVADDFNWLHDNVRLLYTELYEVTQAFKRLKKLPHVRTPEGAVAPRVAAIADAFLRTTAYEFFSRSFINYVEAFQDTTILNVKELWALVPAMKLVLLEQIAARGSLVLQELTKGHNVAECVRSLREITQASWKDVLEPLVRFDRILREDPTGAYARMDYDSREFYREKLVEIAERSDLSEVEVAKEALSLAREAETEIYTDSRIAARRSHIGFYLVSEGVPLLRRRAGFRPSFGQRIQMLMRQNPDEYYLPGILLLTLIILSVVLLALTPRYSPLGMILFSMLILLLPCSQAAVQLMNYLTTAILPAEILPKLDFFCGISNDCVTLVAVPVLLLNADQVQKLVNQLEVRFLGNHDPNLHFALLSDLPDSRELPHEDDPRVSLCAELIEGLNRKYAGQRGGSFLFLHRHRAYNPREGVWMGWERKRGKLLDLNKLLRGQYDSFPVKAGDLSILKDVRFVITLDADTELPRGSAQKMVGAIAHPLNQAIIDPDRNLVVAGYGILQPRVGVSVESAVKSHLANIYSGETGFDIYTRAISDVYQDLYGEGSFAGKGIYEVDTVHRVLDRRFPRNALLSHDLIEGAYARAGLLTDVEVIEDYPSRYSAYNRRKHRWLRGDWQIAGWLFPRVPDETGGRVPNPISLVSQWKILDNLRRSLVEPATLLLFVLGWLVLPGNPAYWTLAAILILFLPTWFQFVFNLIRAIAEKKRALANDAADTFLTANASVLLTLTFLAHQMLVSLDAVVRTFVRRTVTRRRLLEWETAAEAELGKNRRTPVDVYLDWTPVLALGLGILVLFAGRPGALEAAAPILVLWASSTLLTAWLNRAPGGLQAEVEERDESFLRCSALRTWRYFAEFNTAEHHWLVPDNVQEEPPAIAARISPTNIGFLLNCRQAAYEFGYLTLPEFVHGTLQTLATLAQLRKCRGHLLNWYDTRTLQPLTPLFVSSVDSGNLVASLWSLQQGCAELLRRPPARPAMLRGLFDHLRVLVELKACSRKKFARLEKQSRKYDSLQTFLALSHEHLDHLGNGGNLPAEAQWFSKSAHRRLDEGKSLVRSYMPWLLPEFARLRKDPRFNLRRSAADVPLMQVPEFANKLSLRLLAAIQVSDSEQQTQLCRRLLSLLPEARSNAERIIQDLRAISAAAESLAADMDFGFLLSKDRRLLSVGFDIGAGKIHEACYDLLASEARIATFVAIAKDDVPQETWFLLGRAHNVVSGRSVLLSWTGTMFEYLMPTLWMRSQPNTLLDRSRIAAVKLQEEYGARHHVPWGISESAYAKRDEAANYQYHAFGLPRLALNKDELNALVISPYSSFLALPVDPHSVLRNVRGMAQEGWLGEYGFYESADFSTNAKRLRHERYELVRCWMAHHQGMTLLSIVNFLEDGPLQRWFHSHLRVQATELLLQEKPASYVRPAATGYTTATA
jgi:cyclic beta-1,2-glucan glucanotransferase